MPSFSASLAAPLTYLSGWPRRAAALLCLLIAAVMALARHPSPATTTLSLVAASHPVTAGTLLEARDLIVVDWPLRSAPAGAARVPAAVAGRRAAANLGQGMPVTPDDLLEPAIAAALADGQAATTIVLASASQLAILRIGDRVDLYPSVDAAPIDDPRPTGRSPVAHDAQVLSVLPAAETAVDGKPALVVATERAAAAELASLGTVSFIATLVRPP